MKNFLFKSAAGSKPISAWFLLVFVVFVAGCNNTMRNNNSGAVDPAVDNSGPILQGTSSGNPGSGVISFGIVFNTVLRDNCLSCHNQNNSSGGVRYDDYNTTIRRGDLRNLQKSYLIYKEPNSKCTTISNADMDLVRVWIENGAVN